MGGGGGKGGVAVVCTGLASSGSLMASMKMVVATAAILRHEENAGRSRVDREQWLVT